MGTPTTSLGTGSSATILKAGVPTVARVTMKFAIVLITLLVSGNVQGQASADGSDYVQRFDGLNAKQQSAVETYIRQNERPTGELRVLADRKRIAVLSSEALRTLFPEYRFVAVTWITQADPSALHKYSIPGPILHTLVLDVDGRNCMPNPSGYLEEFGDLLHTAHVKVTDAKSAALVRSALIEIYGTGMSSEDLQTTDLRHEKSQWLLGYHEWPFRAISSYEEVREASYYLIAVDARDLVISGRLVTQVLERRKLKGDETK